MVHQQVKEFTITDVIRRLGFSRVCIIGKALIIYPTNGGSIIHSPFYNGDLIKTTKVLTNTLANKNIDKNASERFITFLSEILINSAEAEYQKEKAESIQEQKEKNDILNKIKQPKDTVGELSFEKWSDGLTDRYHNLRKVVENNIPEIWPGLE